MSGPRGASAGGLIGRKAGHYARRMRSIRVGGKLGHSLGTLRSTVGTIASGAAGVANCVVKERTGSTVKSGSLDIDGTVPSPFS
jgi:hypothetical protein